VELTITEPRYRAALEADAGVPVTEVAERYGVSRQAVHRWIGLVEGRVSQVERAWLARSGKDMPPSACELRLRVMGGCAPADVHGVRVSPTAASLRPAGPGMCQGSSGSVSTSPGPRSDRGRTRRSGC
jgi:hypothetical protein